MDELIAAQFHTVAAAAEGCDALVATGVLPAAAGARSAAEKLGIHYVYGSYHPNHVPSPHHPPPQYAGPPFPPDLIDNRVLWDRNAQNANALFGATLNTHRASIGLPPVDNVRDHAFTDHPWLAADPTLGPWPQPADLDVVQTGAWLLPDERPLPDELVAFLDAGTPPVYVGFGSMPVRAQKDIARAGIEASRAQGRRALLGRGWADLAPIDDGDDCFAVGEVNQQTLFGRVAPQGADQLYWAGREVHLGIGAPHVGLAPTAESLSAALETVLAPETRARASAVAGKVRADGATVAARLLLEAVGQQRSPASA